MQTIFSDVVETLRAAGAQGQCVRLRGAGSKDFWGDAQRGKVLDVSAYQGVISYEPSELVVTVRGGTPLSALQALLAQQGQCLAFEPPNPNGCATVGGMVAAGLSGPARASAGAVRDHVLGVRMVNGLGQDLTFGGQVMKNVAGYDASRLMVGSWGTLGWLAEVSLKVLPVAPAEATLACVGLGQNDALDLLHRWGSQPLPLNASAWLHDPSANPAADCLFVRLRGAVAAVQSALPRMAAAAQALGAQVHVPSPEQAALDWQASCNQTLPFFEPPAPHLALWRLSVPQTTPAMDLPFAPYIEWHGAQRWLWAALPEAQRLHQAAQAAGGHAQLYRAPAHACAPDAPSQLQAQLSRARHAPVQATVQRIGQQLQQQFDPLGVLATGRMGA